MRTGPQPQGARGPHVGHGLELAGTPRACNRKAPPSSKMAMMKSRMPKARAVDGSQQDDHVQEGQGAPDLDEALQGDVHLAAQVALHARR